MKIKYLYCLLISVILFSCEEKEAMNKFDPSVITSSKWKEKVVYKVNGNWDYSPEFLSVEYQFDSDGKGIKRIISPLVSTEGVPFGTFYGDIDFRDVEPDNRTIEFNWKLSSKGELTIREINTGSNYSWLITEYTSELIKTQPIEGEANLPLLNPWGTLKAEGYMSVFERKK